MTRRRPQDRTSSRAKASEWHERNTKSSTPSQGPCVARSEAGRMCGAPNESSSAKQRLPPDLRQCAEMCKMPGLGRASNAPLKRSTVATRTSAQIPLAARRPSRSARVSSAGTFPPLNKGDAYRNRTRTPGSDVGRGEDEARTNSLGPGGRAGSISSRGSCVCGRRFASFSEPTFGGSRSTGFGSDSNECTEGRLRGFSSSASSSELLAMASKRE
mmetsp:Transcript_75281/g.244806  ORF Transcript_75281/g.244806 Transcript_75281/m.244806 type:complete len:215 (-) Transcript_75281:1087-1731(-)